jgi:hypothetical protein
MLSTEAFDAVDLLRQRDLLGVTSQGPLEIDLSE